MNGRLARIGAWLRAGARDNRGATAVFFAVGLLLLAPATLGLVDVYMITTQRGQLQEALDTATLYAARSNKMTTAEIQVVGDNALRANLKLPDGQTITSSTFTLSDEGKVTGHAAITPPNVGPRLWDQADIEANSEVLRNSNNVEVALVLDTTGSMSGEMGNLRTAAKDLVELVVKDEQTPYYTKVALAPYSYGVNMGTYETAARGPTRGSTAITDATRTNPVVITSAGHGLANGERVRISGVRGMTELNDKTYIVADRTESTFKLKRFNAGSEDWVNGRNFGEYTRGGAAQCRAEGCPQNTYTSVNNTEETQSKTACATERLGAHAYDDASPQTGKVGWHYGSCTSRPIVPLTSNKAALKAAIDALDDNGSTAGQIGVAWGWYLVSPEWASVWGGSSAPAPYSTQQLLKVVVLMTDGAFNTPYCKGVAARDSGSGAPSGRSRINCDSTNGDPFVQAQKLCAAMKAKGVTVYTVGFNVSADADVQNLMRNCATSPDYVYFPNGGTALKIAFRAIAQDINSLRISK